MNLAVYEMIKKMLAQRPYSPEEFGSENSFTKVNALVRNKIKKRKKKKKALVDHVDGTHRQISSTSKINMKTGLA